MHRLRACGRMLVACLLLAAGGAACRAGDIDIASVVGGRLVRAAGDRILVRLREPAEAPAAFGRRDVTAAADLLPDGRLAIVRLAPGQSVEVALRHFRSLPTVIAAEPDYVMRAAFSPNDPLWDSQCGLRRIQLPGAWNYQRGRPDVTIAILDSGVAYDHPDLIGNLRRSSADPPNGVDDDGNGLVDDFRGWDFADNDNDPHADRGDGIGTAHGTHVAGIAAAVTDNNTGMAGAAWGCSYLPVRVVDAFGVGYLSDVARGIEYAVDQGCAVINLSLEGPFSRTIQAAIDYAYERGVVVCAAAGNTAQEFTTDPATWASPVCNDGDDPARSNHVIGVAAIGCDNVKLDVSNYGSAYSLIDIAAPGRNTTSAWWPGGGYATVSGTSQAAPHIAGAAALLVAQFGRVGPDVITQLLRSTASNIDADNPSFAGKLGAGRASAYYAVLSDSPGPIVGVSVTVVAPDGTGAGRALPGQLVEVQIALRNLGAVAAANVQCALASGDPRVIVKRGTASYGDLAPGETRASATAYRLRVHSDVPQGTSVPLSLTIQANGAGPWTDDRLRLPVGWNALGEPDDTCEDAYAASLGTLYDREIGNPLDRDWFSFPATAGKQYVIETRPRLASSPRTALSIREPACGREVLFVSGEGGPAQVRWVCPATGRYSVGVTGDDELWTGPYRFRVRPGGDGAVGPVQATRLAIDDDNVGASRGNGDGRADPGEVVELRAELTNRGPLSVTGVSAKLTTSRSSVRIISADAAFPDLRPESTGWSQTAYVIRIAPGMLEPTLPSLSFAVAATEGAWDSALRLPIGRSDLGEPDDTCAEGVIVYADDFHHPRAFEQAGDRDWFAFDATAGTSYRFATWLVGDPGIDTTLALHGPFCGAPVAFGQPAAIALSRIDWLCPESGRYGILASPTQSSTLGAYEFSVRPLNNLGSAEPDNQCAKAAPIPADGSRQLRDFGVPGDEDWVRFDAVDGATYVIETGPAPGQTPRQAKSPPDGQPRAPDTVLELYDRNCGAQIAVDDDGGAGLFSRLVLAAVGDGAYSARITEFDGTVGAYEVCVRRNRAPLLAFAGDSGYQSDVVQPQTGVAGETRFRFRAIYSDPDGDPAEFVRLRLFVGGVESPLSPVSLRAVSGDPLTGVRYFARRTLPAGEYQCLVEASDGFVAAIGPPTALTPGPTVGGAAAATATAFITSLTVAAEPRRFAEIRFATAGDGRVSARILNIAGREIKRLAGDRPVQAGINTLTWDGATSLGAAAPPGAYLVEVTVVSAAGDKHTRLTAFRW